MSARSVVAALVVATLLVAAPRVARAEGDAAAAEALFAEARALIKEGRFREACPKLEASLAIDPAVGTMLNLAECLAKTGRNASAWLRYRDAASMALQSGQREREEIARERAKALAPLVCHLVITGPKRADLTVTRDGVAVDTKAMGVPIPVDESDHVVRAETPGESPFTQNVTVKSAGSPCANTAMTIPFASAASPGANEPRGWTTIHTVAVVTGVVGLVATGVGAGFGLSAASANRDSRDLCTADACTPEGRDLRTSAGTRADIATASFVTGAVLVVAGAVVWIVSPSRATSKAASSPLVVRF